MNDATRRSRWKSLFVYRAECTKTTWLLRLGVLACLISGIWLGRPWWAAAIARSLVCESTLAPSDAILIENFDPNYLLFERARELRRAGLAGRVFVPVQVDPGTSSPNDVALGTVDVMARISRIGAIDVIPARQAEPITLSVVRDVQSRFARERIRSVIVVTPLFRSRRSELIYAATLGKAGITVRCSPVQGSRGVGTWTQTWHGVQEVTEQWLKLQYYRAWVLPFRIRAQGTA
jgi:hypothetical protein